MISKCLENIEESKFFSGDFYLMKYSLLLEKDMERLSERKNRSIKNAKDDCIAARSQF